VVITCTTFLSLLSFSIVTTLSSFFFFFYCYGDHRDLHSFPTRRSSDLQVLMRVHLQFLLERLLVCLKGGEAQAQPLCPLWLRLRSEEHTSELQSPCNLVCRLLLEKKKKKKIQPSIDDNEFIWIMKKISY